MENIRGWTVVLHGQGLLHRIFYCKSFAVLIDPRKLRNFSALTICSIQYIGDVLETDLPHGNATAESTRPYVRTCPLVLKWN